MRDHLAVIGNRLKAIEKERREIERERNDFHKSGRILLGYLVTLKDGRTADARQSADIRWAAKKVGRI